MGALRFAVILYFFIHLAVLLKAPQLKWASRAVGYGIPLFFLGLIVFAVEPNSNFVYGVTALPHGDVLEFDYPGSGETGGAASPEAFEAMRDGLLTLVREKAAGRDLVLWGHSLGGFVCSQLAERMPETDGVIIETSARNAKEVSKAWTPWFAGPFVKITIAEGIAAYDNAISLKGFKGPVLVLGALHDQTLPVQLARSLGKALTEEGVDAVYLEFKEGGHSSLPGQTGFAPAIDAFFARVK